MYTIFFVVFCSVKYFKNLEDCKEKASCYSYWGWWGAEGASGEPRRHSGDAQRHQAEAGRWGKIVGLYVFVFLKIVIYFFQELGEIIHSLTHSLSLWDI